MPRFKMKFQLIGRNLTRTACLTIAAIVAVTSISGCVVGNFGLTRKVGQWNSSFSPVPKTIICVALYLGVYEFTMLFDVFLNNTVEFWTDSPVVTAQNQVFHKNGYRIVINNRRDPLRSSTYTVYKSGRVQSVSELRETKNGAIDVYVNGELKAQVKSLHEGLAEISVMSPIDPQIITVKAPKETKKVDFTRLREVRKILAKNELLAAK